MRLFFEKCQKISKNDRKIKYLIQNYFSVTAYAVSSSEPTLSIEAKIRTFFKGELLITFLFDSRLLLTSLRVVFEKGKKFRKSVEKVKVFSFEGHHFLCKKMGRHRICLGASFNCFYPLNIKPTIWEISY